MGNSNSQVSRISDSVDRKHEFIRGLGSGAFGTVSAVRNKATGKVEPLQYPQHDEPRAEIAA
jgi:hypothetical protein